MRTRKLNTTLMIAGLAALLGTGCATNTGKGAGIGGGAGAVAGAGVGAAVGGGRGALIGAGIGAASGAAAGAVVGRYMDRQEAELRKELDSANVVREGDQLYVQFRDAILFDLNQADLRPEARRELERFAEVLSRYEKTELVVEGHTDSTGPQPLNERLSEARAESVAGHLSRHGVEDDRMKTRGFAANKPVATNSTAAGRQQNRRVVVRIEPSEQLREEAESAAAEQQRPQNQRAQERRQGTTR